MNLPPVPTNFSFFYVALGCYACFFVLAVVTRVGKGKTPMGRFHKLHFRTATLYLVGSLIYCVLERPSFQLATVTDFLIGLFVYFGVHYAIVTNFFVLAQSSVSTALIANVYARGGRATLAQCNADYAGGEGFSYVKKNRLWRVQNLLGWIDVRDGQYRIKPAGHRVAQTTKLMLRLWNLKQIGADK